MVKINLEDLSPQTSFPASLGKEKELSLVHYNRLIKDFEKKENKSFIVELLISIAENRANSIECILQYEINTLKDLNIDTSSLICFNKINDFFNNDSLESITVFSSLAQGIPETKSNIHFKDEIIRLSSILEDIVEEHTELYKDIDNNDENLDKINDNIYFLTSLVNTIKNYALKNLKRIASEISSKMTLDEQIKVINSLISLNNTDSNNMPKQLTYDGNAIKKDDDNTIEEAEVIIQDSSDYEKQHNGNRSNDVNYSLVTKDVKELFSNIEKNFDKKLNILSNENLALKENLKQLTEINNMFMNNFTAFMDNQVNLQRAIKEKYNINF